MRIYLNIEAETPDEVMSAIRELSATTAPIHTQVKHAETADAKKSSRSNKPAAPKATESDPVTEITPDKAAEPEKSDEPTEKQDIPTVVDLRAAAQEKGKTPDGKKAIKNLLTSFESKSISDVPENKRAAFLEALGEL